MKKRVCQNIHYHPSPVVHEHLPFIFACLYTLSAAAGYALDVPPLTGRIVDRAGLLPPDLTASLSAELAAHEQRTGNQIALLTLPSLEGEPLEEFSHRVATAWKLGQRDIDNGVLVLVVPNDRRVRIEVGYGLEGTLTDAAASRIIRHEMIPRFRAGDFPGGIAAGLRAIMGTIEGTYTAPEKPERRVRAEGGGTWELFLIAVLIGAFIGGPLLGGQLKGTGSLVSGLLAFMIALPAGLVLALVAAILAIIVALILAWLFSRTRFSGRRRRDWWDRGWGTGWGDWDRSDRLSSPDPFIGGGGDFGGGGASGRW